MNKGKGKGKKPRKPKEPKPAKSKDVIEHDAVSSADDEKKKKDFVTPIVAANETNNSNDRTIPAPSNSYQSSQIATNSHEDISNGSTVKETAKHSSKKTKASKEQKKAKSKPDGPMHFTANNEPRALDVLGGLDPSVFNECKEKMRPCKKALKALDNPDRSLSTADQITHMRACLVSIGKQIELCLAVYKEPEKVKEWRSNLWYFVSKFTEYDAKKLFKLYRHAVKRSEDEEDSRASPSTSSPVKSAKDSPKEGKADKSAQSEKQQKKEKKKKERREKERTEEASTSMDNGISKEETKRRLEEGELDEPPARPYKRSHNDTG